MTALVSSFVVVVLAEMGDKTQLIALTLGLRYRRPWPVMIGILVATLVNHALAAALGAWGASRFSETVLAWVLGVGFLAFGVSVGGGRQVDPLDDEPALLEDPQGRPVAGGGGGNQRTLGDLPQQEVQRPAGDPVAPERPVDPVPDVIPAVPREAGDDPDQLLADEDRPGGDRRVV